MILTGLPPIIDQRARVPHDLATLQESAPALRRICFNGGMDARRIREVEALGFEAVVSMGIIESENTPVVALKNCMVDIRQTISCHHGLAVFPVAPDFASPGPARGVSKPLANIAFD